MQFKVDNAEKRLAAIWGVLLTVLILFSGGYVYQKMEQQSKIYLINGLENSLKNKVQLFVSKLTNGNGIKHIDVDLLRYPLIKLLENSDNQPTISRNEMLQSIANQYIDNNFLATSFYDRDNNEVAHAGEFSENAVMSFNIESVDNSILLWNDQFTLKVTNEIYYNKVYVGKVISEKNLPKLTGSFLNFDTTSATGEFAICKLQQNDDTKMQCLVNGFEGEKVFQQQPRIANGNPLPMSHALDGKTGVIYSTDYRNEKVVATFSPVNKLGLGFVFKIDQNELYSPLIDNLSFIIPVLIMLIIIGILLLHWLVTPLISNLISSQKEAFNSNKELTKQKNLHQLVLDYSPYSIHELDKNGLIVSMNPSGLEMLGIESDVINTLFLDGVSEKDKDRVSQLFADGLKGNRSTFEFKAPNGRTFQSSFIPIQDKDRGILIVMGWSQDITEQKENEELLRRTQKMQSIGELTGGIAHDFNNLLGIIIGNHDLMKRKMEDGSKLQKNLNNAQNAALRGAEITRKLLNFSRQSEEAYSPVNIDKIICEFKDFIRKSITASINLEIHITDNIWLIDLNPGDFQDALVNLSLNARDAMPSGGRLIIEANNTVLDHNMTDNHNDIKAGEYVQISVSDTGTGMTIETVDKIFDPFFTTKDKSKGTGLGLAMVFGFVKRCNGSIIVYSEEGLGTTVKIYLPRSQSGAEQFIKATDIDKPLPRGKETILIVDDEEGLALIAESVLKELGYTTYRASTGDEALEIITSNDDIDIVFSDVLMPGHLNGFDLVDAVVAEKPDIKILLTSGFTGKMKQKESHKGWSLNLLSKPYRDIDLAEAIRKMLDG